MVDAAAFGVVSRLASNSVRTGGSAPTQTFCTVPQDAVVAH
jgi:hypothetical protein